MSDSVLPTQAGAECGVTDAEEAWRVKTYCALRSFCLWLNKGVDVMHYFQAADQPGGMGLLPPNVSQLPADVKWSDVATPPMRAIRATLDVFAGAKPIETHIDLDVEVEPVGTIGQIFAANDDHPPLTHADVFAFLPFQTSARRLVVPIYVMTYDVTARMPEELYRVVIHGLDWPATNIQLIDPITGQREDVRDRNGGLDVDVIVRATDYPRLLVIEGSSGP